MRLHILEHETYQGPINVDFWAEKNNFPLQRTFVCQGGPLPVPDDFDWLVVTGSYIYVWEEEGHPWLAPEKELVGSALNQGKTVIGLCFGAQVIADVLGGRSFLNQEREIGWHQVYLTPEGRKSKLFAGLPETFTSFHWHSAHFDLPPACRSLAYSQVSPNQAFIWDQGPAYGFQFHPEYTLDLIRTYAREFGREWTGGPHVTPPDEVVNIADKSAETYPILETLLNNMRKMEQS